MSPVLEQLFLSFFFKPQLCSEAIIESYERKEIQGKEKRQVKISQRIPQLRSTHDEELAYHKILTILHPVRFLVVNPVHTWILPINLPKGPILH